MKVAFIGMGTMGAPMALNLMKAGHEVTVHNRTREREEPVAQAGAKRAASPKEAAAGAEVVITCVSDTPDVEAMIMGEEGVIQSAQPGTIVIDMSTISPVATQKMARALADKGVKMMDAPVSGGSEGAQKGTLTIMAGGQEEDLEKVRPVLEAMGASITLMGPVGSGQMTKAINQIAISGTYMALAEGLTLGLKAGLDLEKVCQAISGGVAGSWILQNRSGNMIKNEYPLGFKTSLHHKDLGIALDTAKELGVAAPLSALVAQVETSLISQGFGEEDMSNLARAVRRMSGLD